MGADWSGALQECVCRRKLERKLGGVSAGQSKCEGITGEQCMCVCERQTDSKKERGECYECLKEVCKWPDCVCICS